MFHCYIGCCTTTNTEMEVLSLYKGIIRENKAQSLDKNTRSIKQTEAESMDEENVKVPLATVSSSQSYSVCAKCYFSSGRDNKELNTRNVSEMSAINHSFISWTVERPSLTSPTDSAPKHFPSEPNGTKQKILLSSNQGCRGSCTAPWRMLERIVGLMCNLQNTETWEFPESCQRVNQVALLWDELTGGRGEHFTTSGFDAFWWNSICRKRKSPKTLTWNLTFKQPTLAGFLWKICMSL